MSEKDYDPVMHSAEHLLNGAVARLLGCGRAFSTHIEKKKSKCDFHCDRNLTAEELETLEKTVNEQIAAEVEVWDEHMGLEQASGQYSLSRLPEGATDVRIVHIGNYDACPCIGAHVANTREIPPLLIVSSDWNDGVLRVRFKLNHSAKNL